MADTDSKSPSKRTDSNDGSNFSDPLIGFELDERYRLDELIGSGAWGNVYKATDITDGAIVAIKIVHKHHLQDELNIKRFELEAKTLNSFQSPHIVRITDHGLSPFPYLVMEYFDGTPLDKWLKVNGAMKPQMAIDLFLELCDGLSAAESIRIMHRDLKPSNISLKINDGVIEAKILDFGLAKFIDETIGAEKLTSTGEILGSPPYMSPEHWKGQCDNRSDIYSLGCIMYEVLAGQPAFSAQQGIGYMSKHLSDRPGSISKVNASVKFPASLESIVGKCLQKSPANRYQTSAACGADLKKVKSGRKPRIFIAEDITAKSKNTIVVSAVFALLAIALVYLFRVPVAHSICRHFYAQADSMLAAGQAEPATAQYRQILQWSQLLPAKDLQKLRALRALETFYKERNDLSSAKTYEKQIDDLIGRISSDAEMAMYAYKIQRQFDPANLAEAETLGQSALKLAISRLGKQSMSYAACLNFAGTIAFKKGAFDQAIDYYKQSLAIAEELLEPTNFRKAQIMDHLAMALKAAGKIDESEKYSKQSQALKAIDKPCLTVNIPGKKDDLILWDFPAASVR